MKQTSSTEKCHTLPRGFVYLGFQFLRAIFSGFFLQVQTVNDCRTTDGNTMFIRVSFRAIAVRTINNILAGKINNYN